MRQPHPFVFATELRMVVLTGRSAKNLPQLLQHLREVTGSSIFYHTHHQYLSHHFERPMFHNDFSMWVSSALLEEKLSEQLAALDLLTFTSIRDLREAMVEMIENSLRPDGFNGRECVTGAEFHFCESQSFVMPTTLVCHDVQEFILNLKRASVGSLYFHFFEARLRLQRATNDFSRWLEDLGERELAAKIDGLDPYRVTLDELRQQIVRIGEEMGLS
jgi:hypothetical protein